MLRSLSCSISSTTLSLFSNFTLTVTTGIAIPSPRPAGVLSRGLRRASTVHFWCTRDEVSAVKWKYSLRQPRSHLVFACLSKYAFRRGFAQLVNESWYIYHIWTRMSIDLGNFIEFCAKKRKNNDKQAHIYLFAMFVAADKLNSIFITRNWNKW